MARLTPPSSDEFDITPPPADLSPLACAVLARWSEIECAVRVVPENPSPAQMFTTQQLASLLAVSVRTLEAWRIDGRGPTSSKVEGAVRYRYSDVLNWIKLQQGAA